jgi:argininosuccinate synthase
MGVCTDLQDRHIGTRVGVGRVDAFGYKVVSSKGVLIYEKAAT